MSKVKRSFSLWLNLVPLLDKKLKKSSDIEVCYATLQDFPTQPYNVILASLDSDFLNWQRWHFQQLSYYLIDGGYLYLKTCSFPKLQVGFKSFLIDFLKWLKWKTVCLLRKPELQNSLIPDSLINQSAQYGLQLVKIPKELKPYKNQGIVFKKIDQIEAVQSLRLQNPEVLLKEMNKQYPDRLLNSRMEDLNTVKRVSASGLIKSSNPNILVLAPHPDDELVGCGGTLLALSGLGAKIHVVQMSEGATCKALIDEDDTVKRTIRWKEAKAVAKEFEFQQYYWPTEAQGIELNSENENKIETLTKQLRPEIIFIPSGNDRHPEHQIVNQLMCHVLKKDSKEAETLILQYPVWGALKKIDYAIEVTDHTDHVLKAMYLYSTAMKAEDYNSRMLAIWQYQSYLLQKNAKKHVEVFEVVPSN